MARIMARRRLPSPFCFSLFLAIYSLCSLASGLQLSSVVMSADGGQPVGRRQFLWTSSGFLAAAGGYSSYAEAAAVDSGIAGTATSSSLPSEAYTQIGNMRVCRVMNGMWQLSGAHGFTPSLAPALASMEKHIDAGLSTFDLADHYGPAEAFVGAFRESNPDAAKKANFLTKWVPGPYAVAKRHVVEAAVARSCSQMRTSKLDALQFHWWDYQQPAYFDTLQFLSEDQRISNLALTNFDTPHLERILDRGIPIVSNQVQYSMLDTRPAVRMAGLCSENGVKLLCYGSLLGGFLSEKWLGKPEPSYNSLETVSLRKYYQMIRAWSGGNWDSFQKLLAAADNVAKRHNVSIPNVAVKWVLSQPAVGAAIVGVRLGLKDHIRDSTNMWSFELDGKDMDEIAAAQAAGRDLYALIGDCGDEYRG
jgi:aryl-alcohol dehydrogenase-like predicted oxidoreductase